MREPTLKTLAKYGLSLREWRAMLKKQGGGCAICGKVPDEKGYLVIDHAHVAGWKHMSPVDRKFYVRGLCCVSCNHFILTRFATPEKFRNGADYLERFAAKLAGGEGL